MRFKCQMIGNTTLYASPTVGNESEVSCQKMYVFVERVKSAKTAEGRHCVA